MRKPPFRPAQIILWSMALPAVAVFLRIAAGGFGAVLAQLDHCPDFSCDFVRHYLPQIRQLFSRPGEVVDGWVYPPSLALALQWLRPFTDPAALGIWTALQLAAALGLGILCRRLLRAQGRWTSVAGAFALVTLSLPVVHCIKWGQISLAIALGAVHALGRRTRGAPAILGLAAGFKIYPMAYLVQPLARRELRAPLVAFGWALAVGCLAPLAVLGPRVTLRFYSAVEERTSVMARRPDIVAYFGGQSLRPALFRWFESGERVGLSATRALLFPLHMRLLAFMGGPGQACFSVLVWLAIAALALATLWKLRRLDLESEVAASLALIAVTLVIGPGWHHYFAFLPWALAVILARCDHAHCWPELTLATASWLLSALPVALLADRPGFYFAWSAWGGTTLSALLAWVALMRTA